SAGFRLVRQRDGGWLIVVFQYRRIVFHCIDAPQLDRVAFELDGDAHLAAAIGATDVMSATGPSARGWGRAEVGNQVSGRWSELLLSAPLLKLGGRQHRHASYCQAMVSTACCKSWGVP